MRMILFLLYFLMMGLAQAATVDGVPLLPVEVNLHDKETLQRGARFYMNYCSGCHSLQYMRYNRMAQDLGLTTFDGELDVDLLRSNLIFTGAKVHDPIHIAMPPEDSRQWFGVLPPDLSLTARVRGPAWIYTYLKSFYADPARPFGSNNLLFPEVAMPNVLEPLLGKVISIKDKAGKPTLDLRVIEPGKMTEAELDSSLEDLVTFLVYVGEPVKLIRYRMGAFVLAFLLVFLWVAYRLKKAYWQKIP